MPWGGRAIVIGIGADNSGGADNSEIIGTILDPKVADKLPILFHPKNENAGEKWQK